jgi:hypothetical protein
MEYGEVGSCLDIPFHVRLIWRNETTCLFQSPTYPGTFST